MFSYLGGKKFQAKWISNNFPNHKTYVEPFGGAFWVYFQGNINSDVNVYNDYNVYLANVFHCAVYKRSEFVKTLKKYRTQVKTLFENIKAEITPLDYNIEIGDVDMAAKYMYIELNTFSGLTINNAKFVDLKGKYKSKYTQLIDKLENPKWQYKLENISKVENLSYDEVIKKYDNKYTLFYCDPPYFEKESYYTKDFPKEEHKKLADTLKNIKGKFVLSYYDFDDLQNWFPKNNYRWQTREFNKQNSSKSVGTDKGEELLIMNF